MKNAKKIPYVFLHCILFAQHFSDSFLRSIMKHVGIIQEFKTVWLSDHVQSKMKTKFKMKMGVTIQSPMHILQNMTLQLFSLKEMSGSN